MADDQVRHDQTRGSSDVQELGSCRFPICDVAIVNTVSRNSFLARRIPHEGDVGGFAPEEQDSGPD